MLHSSLPGSCTLHEQQKLHHAAPGSPQDSASIPSFSHYALDLGEKEESGRTAEREREKSRVGFMHH